MAKKTATRPNSAKPDADRRVRQADRLARVMRVLELIQGHGRWDAGALARELECSERTIHRYLDVLKYAGILYWFDAETRCYRVRPDFKFPALNLTEDELLGQAVATSVAAAPALGVDTGAEPTTQKLAAVSGESARRLLEAASDLVKVLDLKLVDHSRHCQTIRSIQWALLKGKQLPGQYASPYATRSRSVTLHPYRLCLVRQAWYLIGRPVKEDRPKTYRIARFGALKMLDKSAVVPTDFNVTAYFGNAWSVFRGDKTYDVEILFTRDAAAQVTETRWHHTQEAERHDDGSVTLRFKIDGLDEVLWWLLGWAGFAIVKKPVSLRAAFVHQLNEGIRVNSK